MTMAKEQQAKSEKQAFWLALPDQTQGAVHLALQWLAYVYPASELQIDKTLNSALPYADSDLTSRWIQFLDETDVNEHVDALQWMAQTLSREQIPFLVETCWRLLLVDHEFPNHVPLALRLLGQILNIDEQRLHDIGETVFREYNDTIEEKLRAPLLPIDPRYLDRIEWRLYGQSRRARSPIPEPGRDNSGLKIAVSGFVVGTIFGASVLGFMVFGPWDIGRFNASYPNIVMTPAPTIPVPVEESVVLADPIQTSEPLAPLTDLVIETPILEEMSALVDEEVAILPAQIDSIPIVESPVEAPAQPESNRELMAITASILNVRAEPSVDSEILIKLGEGARVWAYPQEAVGLWMKISVEGQVGYASTRFMRPVD